MVFQICEYLANESYLRLVIFYGCNPFEYWTNSHNSAILSQNNSLNKYLVIGWSSFWQFLSIERCFRRTLCERTLLRHDHWSPSCTFNEMCFPLLICSFSYFRPFASLPFMSTQIFSLILSTIFATRLFVPFRRYPNNPFSTFEGFLRFFACLSTRFGVFVPFRRWGRPLL